MEKHFYPEFNRQDLINHGKYHLYLMLAIDGKTSNPFSAITLPPFYNFKPQGNKEKIVKISRGMYASKKEAVERVIEKQAG